ncbi:MAG: MFS transporter [Thaumarchaeota archaeon]|nr:MFS transporter [Nitrososphaerota archaeon]
MLKSIQSGPFLLVFAYGLTQGFIIQMIGPIFPLFLYEDLNVQVSQIGVIVSILPVVSLITKIPLGAWIQPKQYVPAMLIGSATMALMPFAYSLSQNIETLILFRMIHGISTAITVIVNLAVVTLVVSRSETQKAVVYYTTAFSVGLLLGPLVASFIVTFLGLRYSLAISSAIALSAPIICIGFLKYHGLMKDKPVPARQFAIGRIFRLMRTAGVAVPSIVAFAHSFLLGIMLTYGSLYAKLTFKLHDSQVALLFFGLFTMSLLIRLRYNQLLRLWSKTVALAVGLSVAGLSLAFSGSVTVFPLFVAAFVAFGIAHGLMFPTATILVADSTSFDDRALGSSIFLFCFDIGQLTGPIAISAILPFLGIGISMTISSAVVVLGLFATFYLKRSNPFL